MLEQRLLDFCDFGTDWNIGSHALSIHSICNAFLILERLPIDVKWYVYPDVDGNIIFESKDSLVEIECIPFGYLLYTSTGDIKYSTSAKLIDAITRHYP